MKILYVTTIGITMTFFKQLVRELIAEGHTIDIMCNEADEKVPDCYREWNCNIFHHSCSRSPFSKGNIVSIRQIKNLVREQKYDIVHCHTPIAAMCTRVACKELRKSGVKVMYTAHGFHFYKGAPKLNWALYYPIEKVCSYWTDVLITINHEDYDFAKFKMKAKKIEYVPGVGIDFEGIRNTVVDRSSKRGELGIKEDAFLLMSVGELNRNKNHEVVIRAIAELKKEKVHYVIAGTGELESYLENLSYELGISEQIHLLGYRKDIPELYKTADICCFPSIREGLGLAALEGMAAGLPIIAAINRGTKEYIRNDENGYLIEYKDAVAFADRIESIMLDNYLLKKMSKNGAKIASNYSVSKINELMKEIYFE